MEKRKYPFWKEAVGYIIYPSSFKDSNDDGIGDLKGIASKLDYLKDLGVNLIWICPIFASPMDDNGYDVSDYFSINPRYGTMEDFDELLKKAHSLGIRVLLDFVLNHTSDEHPWFKKALADPGSPERKYYFFRKGKMVNGRLCPPNNWKGFFSESVWTRVEGSDDFYFHIFSKKMPDVDWSNPELRERYYEIGRFWLDKGVDGFRLDAVAHLAKDLSFEDSSLPSDENGLVYDTDRFSNRKELFAYLSLLKKNLFSKYECCTVGEAGGCITPEQSLKMSDRENGSINLVFNFDTCWENGAYGSIGRDQSSIKTNVLGLKRNFMRWYSICHDHADMPIYWNNHDHPRCLSQYGSTKYRKESAKMLVTAMLFLYGTMFIHYGDEIGMSNVEFDKPEQFFFDVSAKNEVASLRSNGWKDEEITKYLNRCSRVNGRGLMQWDKGINGGFSSKTSFCPPSKNYLDGVNVADESIDDDSILNFFKKAIALRKIDYINRQVNEGKLSWFDEKNPDVFAYTHEGERKLMVICNFRDKEITFKSPQIKEVLLSNYQEPKYGKKAYSLRPFECIMGYIE